jgi:hypothetical protein
VNRKRIPVKNGQELVERQSLDNLQKMCIKQAPNNPPTFRTEFSIFAFFLLSIFIEMWIYRKMCAGLKRIYGEYTDLKMII